MLTNLLGNAWKRRQRRGDLLAVPEPWSECVERVVATANEAAILDALPAHIALVDGDGVIISVNEAWRRFAAANGLRTPAAGVGCNYLDVCEDATGPDASGIHQIGKAIRAVLQGRLATFAIEYACHSPAERRWFTLTVKPVPADRTRRAVVMHEDISARRYAETASAELSARTALRERRFENELRASDEKFQQFAANINDVFWIRSPDMSELYFLSPGFERIWGRPVESLRSNPTTWADFVVEEDRERVVAAFAGLQRDVPSLDMDYRIMRPDGEIRWVRARGFQVRDALGTHIRNIGVATDITERQQAQDALRRSQKRLRDVFDGLGPAMFVALLTADGVLVEINRSPLEAAGLRAEDVIGKPFAETHWWTYSPEVQLQLRASIDRARCGESSRYDVRTRGAGDAVIDIDFSLEPLLEESGNIRFLIASASVITDRKIAEGALRQAQKMEAVGQLAAGVAHEFNNLLQALMSTSAIIRYQAATPAIAKTGTDLESLIKRGAGLTQQLLLFARDSAIEKSELDLGHEVRTASAFLRSLMPETIAIVVEVASETLHVEADAGQMQQVLLNLAINARDAMPAGGTLTLRAGRVGGEVFQEVEDTGHGMSADIRAHLFEPFFSTKKPEKGTGLGLAVAHGIVEQHGGRFEVHSSPGEGSRFRMILPASINQGAVAPAQPAEIGVMSGAGRVFLVEDDEPVRVGVATLLELMGYEVVTARSGEEAIARTIDPAPQLLLSDVTLPGITGPHVAALLLERWPDLKIVLMSGYFEETMQNNASRDGWHFLQKPFELDELAGVLASAMDANAARPRVGS